MMNAKATRFMTSLATGIALLLGLQGCIDRNPATGLTKEEAAQKAKADWVIDYCEENGWYGDDACDDFCVHPDPDCLGGACNSDADCASGVEWCQDGQCQACDNAGLYCELYCPNGMVERNGCTPCECAPAPATCAGDDDCGQGTICEEGTCLACDPAGPMCELYCEHGFVERNGCPVCRCAEGPAACAEDADCTAGEQWCEGGLCVDCDNAGLTCEIACSYGFVERNGCTPCECAPRPETCEEIETEQVCENAGCEWRQCPSHAMCDRPHVCVSPEEDREDNSCEIDEDCLKGEQWCEEGQCVACDNSGLVCMRYCEYGMIERNGCVPCTCADAP